MERKGGGEREREPMYDDTGAEIAMDESALYSGLQVLTKVIARLYCYRPKIFHS